MSDAPSASPESGQPFPETPVQSQDVKPSSTEGLPPVANENMPAALAIVSDLEQFEKGLEQQRPKDIIQSELHWEHARIKADVGVAIVGKIGAKAMDISNYLDGPKFVAEQVDPAKKLKVRVETLPGDYSYDTARITINKGRERLTYRNADFHDDRTHDIEYSVDLSETNEKDEKGYQKDYRRVDVRAEYMTDRRGNVIPNRVREVSIRRLNENGGSTWQRYTGDQAIAMLGWLESKSTALLKDVDVRANNELYANDIVNQRRDYAPEIRKVSEIDLEASKKIIDGYGKSAA